MAYHTLSACTRVGEATQSVETTSITSCTGEVLPNNNCHDETMKVIGETASNRYIERWKDKGQVGKLQTGLTPEHSQLFLASMAI